MDFEKENPPIGRVLDRPIHMVLLQKEKIMFEMHESKIMKALKTHVAETAYWPVGWPKKKEIEEKKSDDKNQIKSKNRT